MNRQVMPLSGEEIVFNANRQLVDATVIDFWRWAFSDLQANDLRGVFAEWLVAKLLGLAPPTRDSWGDWDLQTPDGVKIEVKASAFLQAWEQSKLSAISFSGLNGRSSSVAADSTALPTYKADMYIFCVHKEEDRQRWNALNQTTKMLRRG